MRRRIGGKAIPLSFTSPGPVRDLKDLNTLLTGSLQVEFRMVDDTFSQ